MKITDPKVISLILQGYRILFRGVPLIDKMSNKKLRALITKNLKDIATSPYVKLDVVEKEGKVTALVLYEEFPEGRLAVHEAHSIDPKRKDIIPLVLRLFRKASEIKVFPISKRVKRMLTSMGAVSDKDGYLVWKKKDKKERR